MPSHLKTSEKLLQRIRTASDRKLSADELRKQRVSFVIGSLSAESNVTRSQVNDVIEDFEGRKSA